MAVDIELLSAMKAAVANQPMTLWSEGRFVDWLRDLVVELIEDYAADMDVDSVISTALMFYDSVIRPIDLPYIPLGVEPLVDDAIWQLCEFAIRRALTKG